MIIGNVRFVVVVVVVVIIIIIIKKTSYPIARRLFAMRRYGGGMLYAALPLHMQRGCFRIRTQQDPNKNETRHKQKHK